MTTIQRTNKKKPPNTEITNKPKNTTSRRPSAAQIAQKVIDSTKLPKGYKFIPPGEELTLRLIKEVAALKTGWIVEHNRTNSNNLFVLDRQKPQEDQPTDPREIQNCVEASLKESVARSRDQNDPTYLIPILVQHEKSGEIASCAIVKVHRTPKGEEYLLFGNFVTNPDHRGQGLGTRVLEIVEQIAEQSGLSVFFNTIKDLEAANRLYDKFGCVKLPSPASWRNPELVSGELDKNLRENISPQIYFNLLESPVVTRNFYSIQNRIQKNMQWVQEEVPDLRSAMTAEDPVDTNCMIPPTPAEKN